MNVRTRMAPSPTGEYHIGHIRTVLYNYAFAKKHGGKFVIRIEDTDRTRYVDGAVARILADIRDYGLAWDEGPDIGGDFGPYTQSERLDVYKEYAEKLISSGHAYYCFCTKERLDTLREDQRSKGIPPKYDKKCLSLGKEEIGEKLAAGEDCVVRLNVPKDREIVFKDIVYGQLTFDSNLLDDQVLLKSDGFPTYHLAVVIDDHLMEVSHVMRGNDWLPSAPKHVLLYEFFGWEMPVHAHLPNLKEKDGSKKLSKRFGSVFARQFLEEGYLPEALLNFLMFLGWNPGTEKEIYTLDEFVQDFSLEKVGKTDLVSFDRDKLVWINGFYLRNMSLEELLEAVEKWAMQTDFELVSKNAENSYKLAVIGLVQERMKLLSEFNDLAGFFFEDPIIDEALLHKFSSGQTKEILENYLQLLSSCEDWSVRNLDEICHAALESFGYKPKQAFMTLRIAATGSKATPPLFDTLAVLGKNRTLERLNSSLKLIS